MRASEASASRPGRAVPRRVPKRPGSTTDAYKGCLLFNGNGRPLDPDASAPTLLASMGGNATPIIDQQSLDTGEPSWIEAYHQRLLNGEEPATMAASRLRRITVEEAAALQ